MDLLGIKLLIIVLASFVVTVRSPLHSVMLLVCLFCSIGALLLQLGVVFVAIVYVLVYAGAIAILFLFVIMMFNFRGNTQKQQNISVSSVIWTGFICELICSIAGMDQLQLFYLSSNIIGAIYYADNMKVIGVYLYTIQPFIVLCIGMILFIAMIGAILYTLLHGSGIKRQHVFVQNERDRTTLALVEGLLIEEENQISTS